MESNIHSLEITLKVWGCLPSTLCFIRDFKYDCKARLPHDVLAGLNYSMVVNSCFLLEGVFESALISIWRARAKQKKLASEVFEKDLRRGTGLDSYNSLFEKIVDRRLSELKYVKPLYEGLSSHFTLRHLLAHGRTTVFAFVEKNGKSPAWSDEHLHFPSAYKRAEDYLIKKKLMPHSVSGGIWPHPYLSNEIGDHFAAHAFDVVVAIIRSLEPDDASAFVAGTAAESEFTKLGAYIRQVRVAQFTPKKGRNANSA
jgi:hypothetical protein